MAALRTAQADVANARAQVESARLTLNYTTVTAPISGRAGRAQVTEGALVSAGEGTLLTTIEQMDPVYVNFWPVQRRSAGHPAGRAVGQAPASRAEQCRGDPASSKTAASMAAPGHLDFLELSIDPATGTAALRAEFPNPARLLVPGQFVRARIEAGTRPDGILIPQRAVQHHPGGRHGDGGRQGQQGRGAHGQGR